MANVAYMVSNPDGEGHVIAFLDEDDVNNEFVPSRERIESSEPCVRTPQYDVYAALGYVPPDKLIADGWWFECASCGTRIDDENYDAETGAEREAICINNSIYCCSACMMSEWASMRSRQAEHTAAIEVAYARFPQCFVESVYTQTDDRIALRMTFPGGKYRCTWIMGSKQIMIHPGDVAAWYDAHHAARIQSSTHHD